MTQLPASIARAFDGRDLAAKAAVSALLSTVDDDGWPHLSFLSVGEVVAIDGRVALTLWAKAASAAALERERRGVLFAAADGAICEVRLTVDEVRREADSVAVLVLCDVAATRDHRAPYAEVAALLDFSLHDPVQAGERWARQVAAMLAALEERR